MLSAGFKPTRCTARERKREGERGMWRKKNDEMREGSKVWESGR